jgi:hypothetical protein
MVPDGLVGIVTEPDPVSIADGILRFYAIGEDHFIPNIRTEKKKYTWQRIQDTLQTLANAVQK